MRLLLFSDVHCDATAASRLVELSERVDVVVGAGDFASARHGLDELCDVLREIRKPMVVVPGNAESDEELRRVWHATPLVHVLHGSGCTIDGQAFWGVGGAVPITPFGAWSFDLSEDQASALLDPCPTGAVLVTHSPPYGVLDHGTRGVSLGSREVLSTIRRRTPPLAVCGHIHGSSGRTASIGPTIVVNAGPRGVVHVLSRDRSV